MTSLRIRSFGLIALATAALAGPLAGVAQGASPSIVDEPVVSGTAHVGQPLTYTPGTWNPASTVVDQWWSCTTTCAKIPNTTDNQTSYTVQSTDVGATIEISETATDPTAGDTPATATSTPAGPVPALPTNSSKPTISGTAHVGQPLTYTPGTWNPASTVVDQWWSCTAPTTCAKIPNTTDNQTTYTVQSTDVGATIEISETATETAGDTPATATSTPTAAVTPPPPGFVAAPTINGTAQAGQTLTEGAAKWSNAPTSIVLQWYRCDSTNSTCVAIPAPTGTAKTYILTDTDVGATMQVAETATNAGGSATNYSGFSSAVTNAQQIVPPPAVASGSSPAISGNAQLGRTLTGSGADFDGHPGTFNYQWLRCNAVGCAPIPGETDKTYTPTSADVGDTIAFAETASNTGGTSDSVQSSRTDTITAPSTTTVQTNSSAPFAGQTVTLIATVTSAAGSVKPAGTVDFHANGGAIAGCTGLTLGSGAPTAVCQASFRASVANVTAAYSAARGTFITGSTSSPTTLTVGRAATTLTVTPSGHVSLGSRTNYTAVVHPPASSLTPTGRVTFTDGGKTIKGCRNRALAAKRASCSVKYLGIKAHRISARYTGDANFAPSASITSHVLVQPQTPKGFVAVYMNWTFGFGPHSTTIKALSASGISPGIGLSLTCSGSGCPFKHHKLVVKSRAKCAAGAKKKCAAPSSIDLTPIFGGAHLSVGTSFTVAITHSNWVGKYYRFTIRAGHRPSIAESCLAVNGTRPGVGCRAS